MGCILFVTVACFIMVANLLVLAKAGVTVEIKFREFNNTSGRDENGLKCEGGTTNCEMYFKLCVKLSRNIGASFSNCDYRHSSERTVNDNTINFQTQKTNINKTILLKRPDWDGYVSFYMEAWDDDTFRDDKIDTYTYTQPYSPAMNGSGVEQLSYIPGARPTYTTSLSFSVRVFCDLHYYGSVCNTYCKDRNDSSGHYHCSPTGARICHLNWYNSSTCLKYCAPQNDAVRGHYVCASNGSRVCRQSWYNLPDCKTFCVSTNDAVYGHFSCSSTGEKLCHIGWYGPNCTIFCLPRINDHYNCSETGSRRCHKHWHGTYCEVFCKSHRDATNGFYNCSNTGLKICEANYFGENCTVYCKETQSFRKQFLCDNSTGSKLCLENWTGKFCNVSKPNSSSSEGAHRPTSVLFSTNGIVVEATVSPAEILLISKTPIQISSVHLMSHYSTVRSSLLNPDRSFSKTPALEFTSVRSLRSRASFGASLKHSTPHYTPCSTPCSEVILTVTQASEKEETPVATVVIETKASTLKKAITATTTEATTAEAVTTTTTANDATTATSKSSPIYQYESSSSVTQKLTTAKPDTVPNKKKSESESKNVNWLVETKDGKTVLVGAIFSFFLLVGVIILIVMYLRSPKKHSSRNFENLNEILDEWKTKEQSEKSFFNPLYQTPDKSTQNHSKKKQSKLEKFYTRKSLTEEEFSESGLKRMPSVSYNDSEVAETGIYENPLFGIRNVCYETNGETEF